VHPPVGEFEPGLGSGFVGHGAYFNRSRQRL
jgi:hypothetical protein